MGEIKLCWVFFVCVWMNNIYPLKTAESVSGGFRFNCPADAQQRSLQIEVNQRAVGAACYLGVLTSRCLGEGCSWVFVMVLVRRDDVRHAEPCQRAANHNNVPISQPREACCLIQNCEVYFKRIHPTSTINTAEETFGEKSVFFLDDEKMALSVVL